MKHRFVRDTYKVILKADKCREVPSTKCLKVERVPYQVTRRRRVYKEYNVRIYHRHVQTTTEYELSRLRSAHTRARVTYVRILTYTDRDRSFLNPLAYTCTHAYTYIDKTRAARRSTDPCMHVYTVIIGVMYVYVYVRTYIYVRIRIYVYVQVRIYTIKNTRIRKYSGNNECELYIYIRVGLLEIYIYTYIYIYV
jgi:hypothetical protein